MKMNKSRTFAAHPIFGMHAFCLGLCLGLIVFSARADIATDMDTFFNDLNFDNVTRPGVYEGQSAGYFTGGGVFMRVPQRNYTLYSVQWPRFRSGCGGIDFFSGGFSFINTQEFVAMLQNIGSVAVSQAFLLALRTISPQIASTMEQLQTWAQQYGLNSINACEAGSALAGGALKTFGMAKQACIMERVNSRGEAWSEAEVACTTGGERMSTLRNSQMKRLLLTEGNLAWRAMMRNPFYTNDKDLAQVMMNLSGTVIMRVNNPGNENTSMTYQVIPSILADNTGQDLLRVLLEGGRVTVKACSNGTADEFACTIMNRSQHVTINQGLIEKVRTILNAIVTNIHNDTRLDAVQQGLLASTSLPVHKYLTVGVAYIPGALQPEIESYATLIAKDILYTYLNDLLGKLVASVRALENKEDDKIKDFLDGVIEARREIRSYKDDVSRGFDETLVFTQRVREYEKALVGKLSPGMFRSLVWASAQ